MSGYTIITGASSGIGCELARVFARNNHNLLLVARRKHRLEELTSELSGKFGVTALGFSCDITQEKQRKELFNFISRKSIQVDMLINNAGQGDFNLFEKSSLEKNAHLIELNVQALIGLCHHFIPEMLENKKGRILNIASMAAFMPGPYIAVYAASKSFVLNFSLALAAELENKHIQVSVLCPGDIKTEFQQNANLEGFEVNSKITLKELARYSYDKFILEKETVIVPPETQKHIDMMTRSGSPMIISRNLFKMRNMLAKKIGKN